MRGLSSFALDALAETVRGIVWAASSRDFQIARTSGAVLVENWIDIDQSSPHTDYPFVLELTDERENGGMWPAPTQTSAAEG